MILVRLGQTTPYSSGTFHVLSLCVTPNSAHVAQVQDAAGAVVLSTQPLPGPSAVIRLMSHTSPYSRDHGLLLEVQYLEQTQDVTQRPRTSSRASTLRSVSSLSRWMLAWLLMVERVAGRLIGLACSTRSAWDPPGLA